MWGGIRYVLLKHIVVYCSITFSSMCGEQTERGHSFSLYFFLLYRPLHLCLCFAGAMCEIYSPPYGAWRARMKMRVCGANKSRKSSVLNLIGGCASAYAPPLTR